MDTETKVDSTTLKHKFPKSVMLIWLCELFESISYYGAIFVLRLYIEKILHYSAADASVINYTFILLTYVLSVAGAIISDNWIGKFRTTMYCSMVCISGLTILTLSAVKPAGLSQTPFCMMALILIVAGIGPIKPCIAAFYGDQFILPEQNALLNKSYYLYFFAIHAGTLISILLLLVTEKVNCFGEFSCCSLGFGVSSALMTVATFVLFVGNPFYRTIEPKFNVIIQWIRCIGKGIKEKIRSKKKVAHWLDHSEEHYGKEFVDEVKITLRTMPMLCLLVIFWATYQKLRKEWSLQETQMDEDVKIFILADLMNVAKELLIVFLTPLFPYCVYPLCAKCNLITTLLQRMACGGILLVVACIISACISLELEKRGPTLPDKGECQIRFYNSRNCSMSINALPYFENLEIGPMGYKKVEIKNVKGENFVPCRLTGCGGTSVDDCEVTEEKTLGYYLSTNGLQNFKDDINKAINGRPRVRTLVDNPDEYFTFNYWNGNDMILNFKTNDYSLFPIETGDGTYKIGHSNKTITFHNGAVYAVLVSMNLDKVEKIEVYEITKRNTFTILWCIPQYFFLSVGLIMVVPTSMTFVYTQSPKSMTTMMMASWFLTIGFGGLLCIIMDLVQIFEKQSNELFMYGACMFVDMIIFTFMARKYKYVEKNL